MEQNDMLLVTGADGFIGSHLTQTLLHRGHRVRALVWYNSFGHNGWLDDLPSELTGGLEIVAGDIRDSHAMAKLIDGVDTLFHLASLIGVPYSFHAPDSYIQTNVTGTLNLLHASCNAGVKRFVHTSTSEVYGSAQRVPMDETHPLSAQSPYAASKIAADELALSFHHSQSLPVVLIRPFNTYGPRQSARAIIPTIITQLRGENRTLRLGSLSPRRDFSFVTDTVDGLIAAANAENAVGQIINLGSGEEVSIRDLALRIAKLMDVTIEFKTDTSRLRPASAEVDRLLADNRMAERLLNWSPSVSLDDGLQQTIDWFADEHSLTCYYPNRYTI